MTAAMKKEEHLQVAKELEERQRKEKALQEKRQRKEKALEEERQRKEKELEEAQRVQVQLQLKAGDASNGLVENTELMCVDEGSDVTLENSLVSNQDVQSVADVPMTITIEAGVSVASEGIEMTKPEEREVKKALDVNMNGSHMIYSDAEAEEATSRTSNTSTQDDSQDLRSHSEDSIDPTDFSTTMAIDAPTVMSEEDFKACEEEEAAFWQKVDDMKETLEFAGVRQWKEKTLHALSMSGPIGLSVCGLTSLTKICAEIKQASVLLKQIDEGIVIAQKKVMDEREKAKRDLEVWNRLEEQVHGGMDKLGEMRTEEWKASRGASGCNQNNGGGFMGFRNTSKGSSVDAVAGKRSSVYTDGKKKQKRVRSVNMNPFDPRRVGTPGGGTTPGKRSETVDQLH